MPFYYDYDWNNVSLYISGSYGNVEYSNISSKTLEECLNKGKALLDFYRQFGYTIETISLQEETIFFFFKKYNLSITLRKGANK